jgi:hypothetical protein
MTFAIVTGNVRQNGPLIAPTWRHFLHVIAQRTPRPEQCENENENKRTSLTEGIANSGSVNMSIERGRTRPCQRALWTVVP